MGRLAQVKFSILQSQVPLQLEFRHCMPLEHLNSIPIIHCSCHRDAPPPSPTDEDKLLVPAARQLYAWATVAQQGGAGGTGRAQALQLAKRAYDFLTGRCCFSGGGHQLHGQLPFISCHKQLRALQR